MFVASNAIVGILFVYCLSRCSIVDSYVVNQRSTKQDEYDDSEKDSSSEAAHCMR